MNIIIKTVAAALLLPLSQTLSSHASESVFTRLAPLPPPKILNSAQEYPGGNYKPQNLLDENTRTEYSSNAKGTNTFVEFDFGQPAKVVAFRHVDRNDPAIIAESVLEFRDASGQAVAAIKVPHASQRAGVTFFTLPSPVTASRVFWRVSRLGPQNFGTVGGAELAFYTAGKNESLPRGLTLELSDMGLLERQGAEAIQPVQVKLDYPYVEPVDATVKLEGMEPKNITLKAGGHTLDFALPAAKSSRKLKVTVEGLNQTLAKSTLTLKPVRPLEIYLLPHSHVDIGYTALQADVEKKQNENIDIAMDLIRKTRDYPEGARFKWNVEVLWPVFNYLRTGATNITLEKREALLEAIRRGEVGLDAFLCNILTGLCRPEELLRLMTGATKLAEQTGVKVESAMISDVPGYTWSTVSAMAHAGVKYFSFAPNYFDRMGGTMVVWQNKPFYWVGPDGQSKVLCWCPSKGYALGHLIGDGENLARYLPSYVQELKTNGYPYDITHLRWNVHGDNGSPDEKVADVVRDWNARYVYPKLIITTTADAFRKFEARYGKKLPEFRGDYTPYWEDGAGSSAQETALNRASAERLIQAEALEALQNKPLPAGNWHEVWANVLLYSEHTWGAHNSISQPDIPFVKDQWRVKQAFALDADKRSKQLLGWKLQQWPVSPGSDEIAVFNTTSWPRTGLVLVPANFSEKGDQVTDSQGKAVPAQRLSTGELAILADGVPPLSAKFYRLASGKATASGQLHATADSLENAFVQLRIDPQTGAIASFYDKQLKTELVESKSSGLNEYLYLLGADVKAVQRNGTPRISTKENGPLVASLLVESDAPGCKKLTREIRLVDGLDSIEIINTVDKLAVRQKEGVHFGFHFNVPNGTPRFDVGWAAVRPNVDQIPASCKNWFSVQRWVDISNGRYGVTWAPVDAPLVELGGLTANLIGSQTDHRVWIPELKPSQSIYSWVMNNHWHTNYRADQEGPTVFRYYLRAHKGYSPMEAARFGIACTQPLLVTRASHDAPTTPRFTLDSDDVLVTAYKYADDEKSRTQRVRDDGKAQIIRLFGAAGKNTKVKLQWAEPAPKSIWLSDTSEKPLTPVEGPIKVPGWGIVTLRCEW